MVHGGDASTAPGAAGWRRHEQYRLVLSQRLGLPWFEDTVRGLARINLVQQGGELAYLLRHDPHFRAVRREDLVAVGREVRLKPNIGRLVRLLEDGIPGYRFSFVVISAAPEEVVQSALEDVVGYDRAQVRAFFESNGLVIREWDRLHTDRLSIEAPVEASAG